MADKYAARLKEKNALVQGIKADIKEVLAEKGYGRRHRDKADRKTKWR